MEIQGVSTAVSKVNIAKPESGYRWHAVLLVMGIITINYIDRVNIGVASPTLMKLFNLSPAEMGILMSAFFWSYMLCMVPAGWFLNHLGPRMVVFWSCLGWGLATMLTAAVTGFTSFFAVRVLLGVTEAPGYPGAARVVSVWVPVRERTFASACFDACSRAGNAFAPPLVVWIILQWGWQMSFVITGGLAAAYAFVWLYFYREPDDHPKITQSELKWIRQDEVVDESGKVEKGKMIPLMQLLTYPKVVSVCIAYFLYMYFWTTFNLWTPAYFVQAKGFSLKAMGIAAMYPYITGIIFELISGKLWDAWLARGATINTIRRAGMGVGMLGASASLYMAIVSSDPTAIIFWFSLSMGMFSISGANVWAIPQDIAPYGQAGGVGGVYSLCGNLASLIGPMLTGYVAGTSWGYDGGFYLLVISAALGALLYAVSSYTRLVPRA